MTSKTKRFGFWDCMFPKQLGNLCFIIFLIGQKQIMSGMVEGAVK